ncbi:type II secretion system protein J [Cytobacillus sp. Hz8]|uniref:PulJ/GspJ family protein n=1 Tax=Cytobacillus sp. Hz8 TaxID=3347168 RepID=UPI0035DF5F8D
MRKLLTASKGMTLIEVLATLVITAIVSGVVYSVFITGIKLYQKIGIESQLRDDADYIATMILNEMYNYPPNYITDYDNMETGAKGIELVRYKQKVVNGYLIEEPQDVDEVNYIDKDLLIYYLEGKFFIEDIERKEDGSVITNSKTEISTDSSKTTTVGEDSSKEISSISIGQCSRKDSNGNCQHGRINLNLVIDDIRQGQNQIFNINPLILKSSFGY